MINSVLYGSFLKSWSPHHPFTVNGIFHYKPFILATPHLWKPPDHWCWLTFKHVSRPRSKGSKKASRIRRAVVVPWAVGAMLWMNMEGRQTFNPQMTWLVVSRIVGMMIQSDFHIWEIDDSQKVIAILFSLEVPPQKPMHFRFSLPKTSRAFDVTG